MDNSEKLKSSRINNTFLRAILAPLETLLFHKLGAPDKPCGVGRADANPKLLLNDT